MSMLSQRPPKYRKHRPSGQAVVSLSGRDFYLGPHNSKASKAEYDRLVGEWLANGRQLHQPGTDLSVAEVAARFWTHALSYYRKPSGLPTSEQHCIKTALKPLLRLYSKHPAREFSPLCLAAVRGEMIRLGWCRTSVNANVARIKLMFRWAVAQEIVLPSVHHALSAVAGLRAGRCDARESEPVKPVSDATVEQTVPFLPPMVAAMARLQLLTGARPGEILMMRTGDIDRSGEVWTYSPASHKTQHHGHSRTIFIGVKGQEVLRPFLKMDPTAFIFSPADSEVERRAEQHAKRKTPLNYGNRPGTNRKRKPKRQARDRYDVNSYRRAISRACDAAFPPPPPLAKRADETHDQWEERLTPEQRQALATWQRQHRWHPHQLRHSAATAIRKQFGIEAAQHVLGHSTLSVTEIYAEKNAEAAKAIAAAIG